MTIPGWTVVLEEGLYIATRVAPLTEYQRRYGAIDKVDSPDQDELLILAAAQSALLEQLTQAEAIHLSRSRRLAPARGRS